MSIDDFCYEDPEKFLNNWLNMPYGMFSTLREYVGEDSLPFVKDAFLEGYRLGLNARRQIEWREQMQK